jgi:hypothetical protein
MRFRCEILDKIQVAYYQLIKYQEQGQTSVYIYFILLRHGASGRFTFTPSQSSLGAKKG